MDSNSNSKRQRTDKPRKGRKWCFTAFSHNEKELHETLSKDIVEAHFTGKLEDKSISYYKVALERGSSGKLHLQGYLELTAPSTVGGCQKANGDKTSHCELAWKPEEAISYIGNLDFTHSNGEGKGGDVIWLVEGGKHKKSQEEQKQGKGGWNETLLKMKAVIDGGGGMYDLWQEYFIQMIYCNKAMSEYQLSKKARETGEAVDARKASGMTLFDRMAEARAKAKRLLSPLTDEEIVDVERLLDAVYYVDVEGGIL